MKVGILGGTFDPVHNGHLAVAEQVKSQLKMDEVIFIPAGQPWLKKDRFVSAAEHRREMLQLAIEGKPYFQISTVELNRPGNTYTIDTINRIKARLAAGYELYFITGWDKIPELHLWKDVTLLLEMCRLVAVPRPGYSLPDLKELETAIPGAAERIMLLDEPHVDISASEIRQRVRQGLPISNFVPEAVALYIRRQALYSV